MGAAGLALEEPAAADPRPMELVRFRSPLPEGDRLFVRSGVLHLAAYSPLHESYGTDVLLARIDPALDLGQFQYHTDPHGLPLAFCNWAWLSDTVLADVAATGRDLMSEEFRCGEHPFFYEFLAPFGHARAAVRALRSLPDFAGRSIPAIRGARADGGPRVRTFRF